MRAILLVPGLLACGSASGSVLSGDASVEAAAPRVCVDAGVEGFSTSCSTANDCVTVRVGAICSGDCDCVFGPTAAIRVSEKSRYVSETASIALQACPCPAFFPPGCDAGHCVLGAE